MTKRQKADHAAGERISAVLGQELEEDLNDGYDILDWIWEEDDDNAPLEDQVKWLKERNHNLEIYIRNSIGTTEYLRASWGATRVYNFKGQLKTVFHETWNWSMNWGCDDSSSLSSVQKREVIASLEGYIIQEDFDKIYSVVRHQRHFCRTLAEIFLNKTVIDTFFRHPFWYVEEDVHPSDKNDVPWEKVSSFGKKLETLNSQFSNVYVEYAQIWRSITTRLCNITIPFLGRRIDMGFGEAMRARRDAKCRAMAADLLTNNKTFLSLLKPTGQIESRLATLACILVPIAECCNDCDVAGPRYSISPS
ncbi:hypothetical protein BJX99DRAFT_265677 [Aspergillus californicus]